MRIIKKTFKRIYYFLSRPLYRVIKHEILQEVHRVHHHHLESQTNTQQQLADEFVKIYKAIDEIKFDQTDVKLNVTIVNELIKIHQSIQELKNEQDRK
jgi:hypothetical protein